MTTWKEALDEYYRAHQTLNDENRAWLRKVVLLDAPRIDEMERQQVLTTFATSKGKFNNTLFLFTILWQTLGCILCGEIEPLNGNVRGLWYTYVDPLYQQFSLYGDISAEEPEFRLFLQERAQRHRVLLNLNELRATSRAKQSYIEKQVGDCFKQLVANRILRYNGPFKIFDHLGGAGLIGSRASLLFIVEKEGLREYCQRYYDRYNISVLWGRGEPSLATCEYFGDQLLAKRVKRIHFGMLVDYDPPGYLIARTYPRHFECLGFETKGFTMLTSTDLFTDRALELYSEDIDQAHPDHKKINDAWFKETNGINGKRRSIHVNKAMKSRVDKAVDAWYQAAIERSPEDE